MAVSRRYDLVVAGGGVAGPAAAITAARQGAHVLMLERGRLPRHKVCGEFVSAEALQLLGTLLQSDTEGARLVREARRIRSARLLAGGRVVEAAIAPQAASIGRYDLDYALWRAAEEAGVECRQQAEVEATARAGEGFIVKAAGGEIEARAVVNAAGRWSKLARPSPVACDEKWLGVKAHFCGAEVAGAVDLYFFEGGYCGVQPVTMADGEARLNVCAMVRADVATTLEQVLARDRQLWRRSREWEAAEAAAVTTSPLRFAAPAPLEGGVLQAGDAAGFIDPFLGDGISLALHSGWMAAEALAAAWSGGKTAAEAAGAYDARYRRELLPAFRRAQRMRRALRFPASALALMRLPGMAGYVVRKTRVGSTG
jgi:menaquinone-9 beta-reductase